jgi:Cu(I)/Ag(I) efflux system membrane fusion protein
MPASGGCEGEGICAGRPLVLDNTSRTLKVRVQFPNPGFKLKPDMWANVTLKIDYGPQLSVPESASLDSGTEQIVFVALTDGYFEPRKIRLGAQVDSRHIVLSGLKRGERIVTSGNFLIDSESKLKSALSGMGSHVHD